MAVIRSTWALVALLAALTALTACAFADTDDLEARQCRLNAQCTTPGYACEAGFCQRREEVCTVDDDCEDGSYCNGVAHCDPDSSLANDLGCVSGAPPAVNDGIACTRDACDESTRSVVHTPSADCICETNTDHESCVALATARDQTCDSARCNAELTCDFTNCR